MRGVSLPVDTVGMGNYCRMFTVFGLSVHDCRRFENGYGRLPAALRLHDEGWVGSIAVMCAADAAEGVGEARPRVPFGGEHARMLVDRNDRATPSTPGTGRQNICGYDTKRYSPYQRLYQSSRRS